MSDRELKLRVMNLELELLSSICAEMQIEILSTTADRMENVFKELENKIVEEQEGN